MHFSQTSPSTIRKAAHEAGIWLLRPWKYISLKISSESNLIQPATCLTTPVTLGILYLLLEKMCLMEPHKNARKCSTILCSYFNLSCLTLFTCVTESSYRFSNKYVSYWCFLQRVINDTFWSVLISCEHCYIAGVSSHINILGTFNTHRHTHTHTHTDTHTHTHVGFYGLRGLFIGVMVFILYKLYVLLPYTYPTPKLSPHRRRCISTFPPKNLLCMIYKHFELWGHWKCPHKSPSPCNTHVIPMSLYKFVSS